jgi:hypothetical protein
LCLRGSGASVLFGEERKHTYFAGNRTLKVSNMPPTSRGALPHHNDGRTAHGAAAAGDADRRAMAELNDSQRAVLRC